MTGAVCQETNEVQSSWLKIKNTATRVTWPFAGALLGVAVVDHVIVSSNGTSSLRENYGYLWP